MAPSNVNRRMTDRSLRRLIEKNQIGDDVCINIFGNISNCETHTNGTFISHDNFRSGYNASIFYVNITDSKRIESCHVNRVSSNTTVYDRISYDAQINGTFTVCDNDIFGNVTVSIDVESENIDVQILLNPWSNGDTCSAAPFWD